MQPKNLIVAELKLNINENYLDKGAIYFNLYRSGEIAYLQAPLLTGSGLVDHAFSTRLGGCSSGHLASLNTAYHTGDSEDNVIENRRRFFSLFDYTYLDLVAAIQVHGIGLALFDEKNRGEGAMPGSAIRRCDAMITTTPGLPLTAYSADCMLIYIASEQKPLAALAHAGWRGTLGGLGVKIVRFLQEQLGFEPGRLLVALSPAICKICYRVDDTVAGQFHANGWNGSAFLERSEKGGWNLDLSAINAKQVLAAGVKEKNLAFNNWCTSCNPDLFYSYRREKGKTGRMIGFIAIKNHSGVGAA